MTRLLDMIWGHKLDSSLTIGTAVALLAACAGVLVVHATTDFDLGADIGTVVSVAVVSLWNIGQKAWRDGKRGAARAEHGTVADEAGGQG